MHPYTVTHVQVGVDFRKIGGMAESVDKGKNKDKSKDNGNSNGNGN